MRATVKNLDAPLGAEISGIDLSANLTQEEVELIQKTWRERLVVVFRAQKLTDPQLITFSKNFGELDPPYGGRDIPRGGPSRPYPELTIISNVIENGVPIGGLGDGEAVWHADMTYLDIPPKAAMLYSLEVPPLEAGGNTYFADMFAAYETLPNDLKRAAEGKVAVHDASTNSAGQLRKGYTTVTDATQTIGAQHLLVRTEPNTGRKALFLGRRPNSYVVGLELNESEALLNALWAHATQPSLVMRHQWKVGDLLMWNNLSVLHRRDAFDPRTRRVMHRSQIKGTERIA